MFDRLMADERVQQALAWAVTAVLLYLGNALHKFADAAKAKALVEVERHTDGKLSEILRAGIVWAQKQADLATGEDRALAVLDYAAQHGFAVDEQAVAHAYETMKRWSELPPAKADASQEAATSG